MSTEFGHNFHFSKLTLAQCSPFCQLQRAGARVVASDYGSPEWCLTGLPLTPIQRASRLQLSSGCHLLAKRYGLRASIWLPAGPKYHAPRLFGIVEHFHHLTSWAKPAGELGKVNSASCSKPLWGLETHHFLVYQELDAFLEFGRCAF